MSESELGLVADVYPFCFDFFSALLTDYLIIRWKTFAHCRLLCLYAQQHSAME